MSRDSARVRRVWLVVLWLLIGAFAVVTWHRFRSSGEPVTIRRQLVGVMGTTAQIVAVVPRGLVPRGDQILETAETELRRLEALTSTWIEASELSRLNAAPAGDVFLHKDVVDVLARARELHEETNGAFDVTAGPLIRLWRDGVMQGLVPSADALGAARAESNWVSVRLFPGGVTKLRDTVTFDVDGIAKGWAIDRAVEALLDAGALGGMVEVGGDLRTLGAGPQGVDRPDGTWPVGVRNPFTAEAPLARLELEAAAICTSGAYARPVEIGGRSFSHIIDPASGQPIDGPASVTIVAPTAWMADAWATALAVMGESGLERIPENVEALLVFGPAESPRAVATPDFPRLEGATTLLLERRG